MCSPERGPGVADRCRASPVNRGTTPVIGTSQPWVDVTRRTISRARYCGSVSMSGAVKMRPGGHAVLVEHARAARRTAASRSTRRRARRARPCSSPRAVVGGEARVGGQLGPAHRLAQPGEHVVGVGGDHDLGAVAGRVHVRRRHARAARCPSGCARRRRARSRPSSTPSARRPPRRSRRRPPGPCRCSRADTSAASVPITREHRRRARRRG